MSNSKPRIVLPRNVDYNFDSLTKFLENYKIKAIEGFCQQIPGQVKILEKYAKDPGIVNIMEIGFNCGHSAEIFLKGKPENNVHSFSIIRDNLRHGKRYLDHKYPERLKIVIGESQHSVPRFADKNKDKKFDLIFIDGAHWEPIPKEDLENCRRLAHENTIVLFDDTCYSDKLCRYWNNYPTKIWRDAIERNEIVEMGHEDFCEGRGMSWGKYVFDTEVI
jgi:predicted O-methyltransferase YrrM|tara:strand:+ start:649 stop:1308 length:660 start_codon:yes stop_codon:yes gene_type:complete